MSHIISRASVRAVQTPQIFSAPTLRAAYDTLFDPRFTDDASVVEAMGERVFLCKGDRANIKITTPEDIIFAEAIIESRRGEQDGEDL